MTRRWSIAVALLLVATPRGAAAQGVEALVAVCEAAAPGALDRCTEAAIAARALTAQSGLLTGLGSTLPGAPSTLGRRIGNTPRVALSFRAGGLQLALPDLTDRANSPVGEAKVFVPTLHGSVAVGVFDGLRLMPTVGGFLSLDLVGQTAMVFLPGGDGFKDRIGSLSLGVRVGLLRESFTLPGVSASAVRHFMGSAGYADATLGDPAEVDLRPSVTSYRLTVGKDLLAVGVLAGVGWDDYDAEATVFVNDGNNLVASTGDLGFSRRLFYTGASLNFLVLQLSTEVGWAQGLSPVSGYSGAPHDPTKGSFFGSIAARLTI